MTSTLLKSFHCNNQPALHLLEPMYAFSAIRAAAAAALIHVVVEELPTD